MIIIFNREMADKLPCGIKVAFGAHAAMWFVKLIESRNGQLYSNDYGDGKDMDFDMKYDHERYSKKFYIKDFDVWLKGDYRKLVMTSPETIEVLFEKFKKAEVPVYMQKTSHDIKIETIYRNKNCECGHSCSCGLPNEFITIKSGTPICLSVFLWKEEHKKLLEGCELL